MNKNHSVLNDKSTIVVFASSPAGLGHLRVTEALFQSLPTSVSSYVLGIKDNSISYLHRFTSIHPITRGLMEWFQHGLPELIFSRYYRRFLQTHSQNLYQDIIKILDQRIILPKTVVFVATHFALAHMLTTIKERIEKDKNIRVFLFVQVTDDSPQCMWYVPKSDLIFVPSHETKNLLKQYARKEGLPDVNFSVIPYPVNINLTKALSHGEYINRVEQLTYDSEKTINIAIPISGAAVGLEYFTVLIRTLHYYNNRFKFHLISKISSHTRPFLSDISLENYIHTHAYFHDREVVINYERVYKRHLISLEITKPSEQAFKVLIDPLKKGGSVLLFSKPVGRQEWDNLNFMQKHGLIPSNSENNLLIKLSQKYTTNLQKHYPQLFHKLLQYRALRIPDNAQESARFINWCLKENVFFQMVNFRNNTYNNFKSKNELGDDGVLQFWKVVSKFVSELS